jgi:WASH complex subunit CCDC53
MQTPIDFKTVESVPYRKTITIVNNFIINTTQFLNKFSFLCEKKLAEVSDQIQNLEITMNILEAKLASIPGLEGSVLVDTTTTSTTTTTTTTINTNAPPPPPPPGKASLIITSRYIGDCIGDSVPHDL